MHKLGTLNFLVQSSSGLNKSSYLILDKTPPCLSEGLQKHTKSLNKYRLGWKGRTKPIFMTGTLGPALCNMYSCSQVPVFVCYNWGSQKTWGMLRFQHIFVYLNFNLMLFVT